MTRRSVSLILGLLVLSGCNYDPETRLFRQLAPRPEDVVLQPPGAEAPADAAGGNTVTQALDACEEDVLRCHAQNIANGLNGLTFLMLSIVDTIVQLPPSRRETGRRVWGPHFDRDNGNTFLFQMTREDDDSFGWCLHVAPGDLRSADGVDELTCDQPDAPSGMMRLLSGSLSAGDVEGEAARSGRGAMVLEALRMLELADDPDIIGTFTFVYDNTDGQDVEIAIADLPQEPGNPFGADAAYRYTEDLQGNGTFAFDARANFVGEGALGFPSPREDFSITARWQPDLAGRADATISGGDLAEQVVTATHCWDAALVTSYNGNSYAPDDAEGELSSCVFAEPLPR